MAYLLLKRRAASRTGICRPEENFKGVRIMENKKLLNVDLESTDYDPAQAVSYTHLDVYKRQPV